MTDVQGVRLVRVLFKMQAALNSEIMGPTWAASGRDWHRAIWTEGAELIERLPWKWWKAAPAIDVPQLHLEIVDMLHFAVSAALERGTEPEQFAYLVFGGHNYQLAPETDAVTRMLTAVETVACEALLRRTTSLLTSIGELASASGLTVERAFALYVGKNVLNRFRQVNGYKTGQYVKVWNGREDNEHMQSLLDDAMQSGISAESLAPFLVHGLNSTYPALKAAA
jgi:dimeric dUTPase (all-alpha-NTP-PPase superfamily)